MIEQRQDKVIDYVLNLLPPDARQAMEKQAGHDAELRQAIRSEREIVQTVRTTLAAVTTPKPVRLSKLIPDVPRYPAPMIWQRPLTLAGALLLMVLVVFGWRTNSNIISGPGTIAPGIAVTVTQTESPTMTLTQTVEADNGSAPISIGFVSTLVVREPVAPAAPKPFPVATPILALSFSTP